MKKTISISCWFGEQFHRPANIKTLPNLIAWIKYQLKNFIPIQFYPRFKIDSVIPRAPKTDKHAIFFTNNPKLRREIILKGWEYYFLENKIDKEESIASSLQAKVVKFLQLPDDVMKRLFEYEYVLYMDSRRVTDEVETLITHCSNGIVIRKTPKVKYLWDEVNEAKGQERYMAGMPATIEFIQEKLASAKFTANNSVVNTGLILYKVNEIELRKKILALCDDVFSTCNSLKQPECQIIWCLLSQQYNNLINKVDFETVTTRKS